MENYESKQIYNQTINNAKLLIDRNIYKFLFKLFYYIFLKSDKSFRNHGLKEINRIIDYINHKYIKEKDRKINDKYENKNLLNILKFVKTQNHLYAGEIIENILIIIFSFAFKTKKENIIEKYIYNNLKKLKSIKDDELVEWFIKGKINDKIINIRKLLRNDYLKIYNFLNTIQEEPLIDLLYEIYSEKNIKKEINKKKFLNFTNRRNFDFIIKKLKLDSDELWDNDFKIINDYFLNDYAFFESKYRYDEKEIHLEKLKKRKIPLIRSLFISVYIYYQNQNSTLMKYRNFEENLEIIPYEYNLSEAAIEYNLLDIVMSPLRVDPRIDEIKLHKNILKENGFKELGKILLFNKSIKKIDFHVCQIKSSHIDFLNDIIMLI